MNSIFIMTDDDPSEQNIVYIEDVALFTLDAVQYNNAELSIVCLSPDTIQEYNLQYSGKSYVPDVLSFVASEGKDEIEHQIEHELHSDELEKKYLGDILICQNQILEQAQEHNVNYFEELARIIIHGILHLLGYIHGSYDKSEPMLVKQESILQNYLIKQKKGV